MSDDYRERLYTISKEGERNWVYPTSIRGFFTTYRTVVVLALMAIYVSLPWIEIAGKQAVLLDIPNRKFVFFGMTLWATDTQFLFLALGALAASLFFFTALVGRVWCGWACPETVFLEFLFRPIERWIEGDAAQRIRLDRQPWSIEKLWKKSLKFFLFSVLAWFLASTALAYFVGREELLSMIIQPPSANLSTFLLTLALMAVLLFQFGWFREQFCTVLCPYARFQSVLMDKHSLQVGYDPLRGEPRGKRRKNVDQSELGDCIDCGLCVRVCPTGIDIRNGLQLECIQCANCIDACDSIMAKIDRPPGLIRYDSEARLLSRESTRWLRPRVILYSAFLAVFLGLLAYRVATRVETDVQLVRPYAEAGFRELRAGTIANRFDLSLTNKSDKANSYTVTLSSPKQGELIIPFNPVPVAPQEIRTLPVFIHLDAALFQNGRTEAEVLIEGERGFRRRQRVPLIGPG